MEIDVFGAVKNVADSAGAAMTEAGNQIGKVADDVGKQLEPITKPITENVVGAANIVGENVVGAANIVGENVTVLATTVTNNATAVATDVADNVDGFINREDLDKKIKETSDSYNVTYAKVQDYGCRILNQRERAVDLLENIEYLINSIAKHPKEFDTDIEEMKMQKEEFKKVCDFAVKDLEATQKSVASSGAGIALGASAALITPSLAMWVATTFGTASTGAAISTLSGAAATNAALAWLGGGALVAGGGGMASGSALLALAGPIGWTIAGATLLTSIVIYTNEIMKSDSERKEEIDKILKNTETLKEVMAKLEGIYNITVDFRKKLDEKYKEALSYFGKNFMEIDEEGQLALGALVNTSKSLAVILNKGV